MAVDGGRRRGPPVRMRPIPPAPPRHRPPPSADPGGLPEALGQVVEIATDADVLDLLGHAVHGGGAVVEAIGDLVP